MEQNPDELIAYSDGLLDDVRREISRPTIGEGMGLVLEQWLALAQAMLVKAQTLALAPQEAQRLAYTLKRREQYGIDLLNNREEPWDTLS